MPYVDLGSPRDAVPGVPATATLTRYFLELTDNRIDGWFRTGKWTEEGHPTEAEAWQEWADRGDQYAYTGRRVVEMVWTVTVTIMPEPS